MAALLGCAFSSLEKYCKINHPLENFVTTLLSSFISVTLMKRHSLLWHCQHPWPHHFHLPHRSGKVQGGKERKIRGKMPPQATLVCVDSMLKKITVNPLLMNTPIQQPLFCPSGWSMRSLLFYPLYNGCLFATVMATKASPKLPK